MGRQNVSSEKKIKIQTIRMAIMESINETNRFIFKSMAESTIIKLEDNIDRRLRYYIK
jgi:hypothetical protein